ncbi:EboA domain-containing protein [Metapseudomonas otitidis]|uniref:EboA domain-containing protein n=1 Tax=Metapseudomonas otitidis TaxID=319939 RepID=UPI0013F68BB2|nr:EboA domain-containing protein [Pseudomonas otitidis]
MNPTACLLPDLRLDSARITDLRQALVAALDDDARAAWELTCQRLAEHPDGDTLALLSGRLRRQLGEQYVQGLHWRRGELGRALLLAQALQAQPEGAREALLKRYFAWGDDLEKAALLKALDWLDGHGTCLDLALQATRTNSSDVFAALALDNPYPARFFPERAFQQLMLKGVAMELDMRRVQGLEARRNGVLNQLVLDQLNERLAADRSALPGLAQLLAWPLLTLAQIASLQAHARAGRLPPGWLPADFPRT